MAQKDKDKKSHIKQKAKAKAFAKNRKELESLIKRPAHRPFKDVDASEVERLASMDATAEEIAAYFGVDKQTIYNRKDLFDALQSGRAKGNRALKQLAHEMAHEDRNATMAMFLLKARCGYHDGGNIGESEQKPFHVKAV